MFHEERTLRFVVGRLQIHVRCRQVLMRFVWCTPELLGVVIREFFYVGQDADEAHLLLLDALSHHVNLVKVGVHGI